MKHTREYFIEKASITHGSRYNYDKVTYQRSSIPVIIECADHGDFTQRPNDHLRGRGCPYCGGSIRQTVHQFIDRAKSIHGNTYDYSNTIYVNMDSKVEIICKVHGRFFQHASSHLAGRGCNNCSSASTAIKLRYTTAEFIERASSIHNNIYDYTRVKYVRAHGKVEIVCHRHGSYFQIANDHLQGNKCPMCKGSISRKESNWLTELDVPNTSNCRQVKLGDFIVDGFTPRTNTVYEFLGDYWHGNPKRYPTGINPTVQLPYSALYDRTLARIEKLQQLGYNVVYIWESDWKPSRKERTKCQN